MNYRRGKIQNEDKSKKKNYKREKTQKKIFAFDNFFCI